MSAFPSAGCLDRLFWHRGAGRSIWDGSTTLGDFLERNQRSPTVLGKAQNWLEVSMRLLTVPEVAERLAVCRATVYHLCETGALSHRRIGCGRGRIRFAEEDLKEYLDRKKVKGQEDQPPAPKPKPVSLQHLRLKPS